MSPLTHKNDSERRCEDDSISTTSKANGDQGDGSLDNLLSSLARTLDAKPCSKRSRKSEKSSDAASTLFDSSGIAPRTASQPQDSHLNCSAVALPPPLSIDVGNEDNDNTSGDNSLYSSRNLQIYERFILEEVLGFCYFRIPVPARVR